VITSNIVFWLVWPLLLLIPFYFASRLYWKNKNPIEVTPDNARTPYVAGVSVLAIAIPLVANLTFEVSKTTQRFWIVGVLLAAMMFALVALVIGTILVYRFSIPLPSGNVEISESQAPWMQVQYTAMFFSLCIFLGLGVFHRIWALRLVTSKPSLTTEHSYPATTGPRVG
jgi:membrane protease YdiL (CAAX protease family)